MKSVRNKQVANSSFLSNHDLLQNFRNKSFKLITRESSFSELKNVPKKVSLIQKKTFEPKSKQNKQNEPLLSNRKGFPASKGQTQRQKTIPDLNYDQQVQKIVRELNFIYDQINTQEIQLKMILNKNIRRIKELFVNHAESTAIKGTNDKQKELRDKIDCLNQKIQDQSKKIFKYKMQCEQLKQKQSLYETKIQTLQQKLDQQRQINKEILIQQKEEKTLMVTRSQVSVQKSSENNVKPPIKQIQPKENENKQNQIELLQNIIQTQEQLIQKQMTDFEAENDQFLRLLKVQALQIESMVDKKPIQQEKKSSRQHSNQQRSTVFQSRYNSNTSKHFNSVNQFTSFNSPQKTEDLVLKANKKKLKLGDYSICLF